MAWLSIISVIVLIGSAVGASRLARRSPARAVALTRAGVLAAGAATGAAAVLRLVDGDSRWVTDNLGLVVSGFVLAMAALVGTYANRSLAASSNAPRFFVATNLLTAATVAFSSATTVAWLVAGWLAVSAGTVALIGSDGRAASARSAQIARRRLAVGDAAVVAAGALVWFATGTVGELTDATAQLADHTAAWVITIGALLAIAAAARSGLAPFHQWLIGSIEAPTPVSAMLHAGVVNGSAVLLIRFLPAIGDSLVIVGLIAALGTGSMLLGIAASRTRPDIKGGLAWTTTAQMGFMLVQCALGLTGPAVVHMIAHGLFKSSLFLGAGTNLTHHVGAHPQRSRVRLPVAATSGLVGAAVVAAVLAVVQPGWLHHPAAVLPIGFLWATVATTLARWWSDGSAPRVATLVAAPVALAATVAVSDLVDRVTGLPHDAGTVGAFGAAIAVCAVVVGAVGLAALVGRSSTSAARWWAWCSEPALRLPRRLPAAGTGSHSAGLGAPAAGSPAGSLVELTGTGAEGAESGSGEPKIAAHLQEAAAVLPPAFPLERFVAVNPLLGLEGLSSNEAAWAAVNELGVRAEFDEVTFRDLHREGRISRTDLTATIHDHLTQTGEAADDQAVAAAMDELLTAAPVELPAPEPVLVSERLDADLAEFVDERSAFWVSRWLSTHVAWAAPGSDEGLWSMWLTCGRLDPRLADRSSRAGALVLDSLPADPHEAIQTLLGALGVPEAGTVAYLRRHLVRHLGWSSAVIRDRGVDSADLAAFVAMRLSIEAAITAGRTIAPSTAGTSDDTGTSAGELAAHHVPAVTGGLLTPMARLALWRQAYERGYRDHFLTQLSVEPAAAPSAPDAVAVFCIDPRSEGLRRSFETTGNYDTVGYAGFFGLPVAVQDVQADGPVPSCPVILSPTATFEELDQSPDAAVRQARRHHHHHGHDVYSATKRSFVGPFATAENAGWVVGVLSVAKTGAPRWFARAAQAVAERRWAPTATRVIGRTEHGWSLDQQVDVAAGILTTTGLVGTTVPVVVLCGHESRTVNNLHQAALDCGACGGRSGANNARIAASLLNDPAVRAGLAKRGITVGDHTVFVGAVHETTTDSILAADLDEIPSAARPAVDTVLADLRAAAQLLATERAAALPASVGVGSTTPGDIAARAVDWAQVIPEWGLVANAALVVGSRRLTAGHRLDRRVFLHTYDAEADPTGAVLAAIVGGPLLVGHWISSQYRLSTIDPHRLGAGSKPVHNLVGGVGVIEGGSGDLRIGLPLESVSIAGDAMHEAMRLLVVIDAPTERIEQALQSSPVAAAVADGQWIQLVGRDDADRADGWLVRTAPHQWERWHAPSFDQSVAGAAR